MHGCTILEANIQFYILKHFCYRTFRFIGIPEKLSSESMVSTPEQLDAWALDAWTRELWTPESWTLELRTYGPRKFLPFLVYFFLSWFNVEFLKISNALRLMYYDSVDCAANDCYNSNLLNVGLKHNFSWRGAQIIDLEIIQTDDKSFPIKGSFSGLYLGHPPEKISNFKNKYF